MQGEKQSLAVGSARAWPSSQPSSGWASFFRLPAAPPRSTSSASHHSLSVSYSRRFSPNSSARSSAVRSSAVRQQYHTARGRSQYHQRLLSSEGARWPLQPKERSTYRRLPLGCRAHPYARRHRQQGWPVIISKSPHHPPRR